ncbi:putative UDP-glucose 4-epimerase GalE1 [Nocardiopsis terrae]|uniref:Nucleoside-diphosphate-sugar epimerase n=1 Tax=Nocardiopsis terrae TaxID=372655 RepID=A0ABR9HAA5_9ACTN|nr:NAD-dependent epimerase/dehydratase [Nocardiopsis terrae]MBE1455965.1 nucleoside-diphosphate-sugar epimerase [Nocardiopsis terrae]GHC96469.1 putative UDP-glucose 4-epimerase GalE1 [Nocardiopsis terrae]
MTSPRTVAVLGASGLIGSAVADLLSRRPVDLRLVARRAVTPPADGPARVQVLSGDLTDPRFAATAVQGADVIVHLVCHRVPGASWRVAEGDARAESVNVGTVRAVVEALGRSGTRPPPVCVFAGSTSQAGAVAGRPLDGTEPDRPTSTYDRQKLTAERLLKDATARGKVRAVSLRLSTVFGPASSPTAHDHGLVSTMARRALAGSALTLWGSGLVERDLLYTDDAAHAFAAAIDHADGLAGGHHPVGAGSPVRLSDLFGRISRAVAAATGQPPVPVVREEPPGHTAPTDAVGVRIDPSPFAAATGWSPRVGLDEGLRRTVDRLIRASQA